MKKYKYTLIFLFLSIIVYSQQNNFYPPLDIPLVPTASFGELRTNSFHAGVDFRTNGKTGLPVFNIEKGYVSRIGVSASGYGHVLYIDHPNGLTSVYAHLDSFSPRIARWVKEQQYKRESFEVNLFPAPGQFTFSRGAEIGKTGNTGSSGGPHLHFEIRKSEGQQPVNPFNYNFDIDDNSPPYVEHLFVYPLENGSNAMGETVKQHYNLVYYDGAYRLRGMSELALYGNIGFGVDAIDYFDNNWSRCGIYKLEYRVNGDLIHSFVIDQLNYQTMRYHNSHIDFEAFRKSKKQIHRLYTDPGNRLHIYEKSKNRGVFYFESGRQYKVEISMFDFHSNRTLIEFEVKGSSPEEWEDEKYAANFSYSEENTFTTSNFSISIPQGALYDDLLFQYERDKAPQGAFSDLHKVHNRYTPLHIASEVSIQANELPSHLKEKALLAFYNESTKTFSALGGNYREGKVYANTREFGNMCIVVDTIAPQINSLSIRNKRLSEPDRIRFTIKDELSGISSYRGEINGQWVLFEYDAKRDMLEYTIDNRVKKGENTIILTVEDRKGNINTFSSSFVY